MSPRVRRRHARPVGVDTGGHSPRLTVIWQEAWRNFTSGATRGFWFALAFALLCGGLAVTGARAIVGFVNQTLEFRSSGAAVFTVSSSSGIRGDQCDALASHPGIIAAGALRTGPDITFAVMPDTTISSYEATPGFGGLLEMSTGNNSDPLGAWIASDLAGRLGITNQTTTLTRTDDTELYVAGVYNYPNDGRSPRLAYQVVAPVTSEGYFDECWALSWPSPNPANELLLTALKADTTGTLTANPPMISQLNTTLGTVFNGPAKYAALPIELIQLAAIGIGATLGFISIWTRRLELAATLHAGISKPALCVQILTETLLWLGLAMLPSATISLWAAQTGNTTDWFPAWYPAAKTLLLAGIAALGAAQSAVLLTKESHLFRYFKNR